MYKSSPLTFFFKYIFPVIMLVSGIFGFILVYNIGDESTSNFAIAFGIAFTWVSIFIVQLPFKLKTIIVDKEGMKLKTKNGEQLIPFQKIYSVSLFDISNPWMPTIKYLDTKKNKYKKISYIADHKYQRVMKEDEMTAFLTKQARLNNPDFEESSVSKNRMILFLAGLPFTIGMIYFMMQM